MSNAFLIALPVELLYYIFDHLDARTILRSIRGVCQKLYAVVNSYDRYKLDFDFHSIKKSDILFISRVICPNNVRSIILHNHNPFRTQIELFLTHFGNYHFSKLRSLIVHKINDQNYISTLQSFIGCPLVSLSIHIPELTNSTTVERIFSVIAMFNLRKICLHNLNFDLEHISWLSQCPLQHLTIETCSYDVYREILRQFIHLRSFVIKDWTMNDTNRSIIQGRFRFPKMFNSLSHLLFTFCI
jgi:hypothetical protein